MKRVETLLKAAILLTAVILVCAIGDFLSLHDIKKDYVSKFVLQGLEVDTSKQLPTWTNTELEWLIVTVSYYIRLFSILISLFVLVLLRKKIREGYGRQPKKA